MSFQMIFLGKLMLTVSYIEHLPYLRSSVSKRIAITTADSPTSAIVRSGKSRQRFLFIGPKRLSRDLHSPGP